jgi:hypothetical protein
MAARDETAQPDQATPSTISLSELLSKLSCDSATAGHSARDQEGSQEPGKAARVDALRAKWADLVELLTNTKSDANDFNLGKIPDGQAQLTGVEAFRKVGQRLAELHAESLDIKRDEAKAKIDATTETEQEFVEDLLKHGASTRTLTNEDVVELVKAMGICRRADLEAMMDLSESM